MRAPVRRAGDPGRLRDPTTRDIPAPSAACGLRFTTYERIEAARLVIVKRDGTRQSSTGARRRPAQH
jgi:hypothetical protein